MSMNSNPDKFAKANGLTIVVPEPNQLQLDIDSPKLPANYAEQLEILGCIRKITSVRQTTSKSGNIHVYIDLDGPIAPVERVLLQACMGSDQKRELLTFLNMQSPDNKRPQFLYELAPKV